MQSIAEMDVFVRQAPRIEYVGAGIRLSSIMAELNATKTLAPAGTLTSRRVPAAMVLVFVAVLGKNGAKGIEAHRLEHISSKQEHHRFRALQPARRPAYPDGAATAPSPAAPPSAAAAGRRR